jgi:hypothetical protein
VYDHLVNIRKTMQRIVACTVHLRNFGIKIGLGASWAGKSGLREDW